MTFTRSIFVFLFLLSVCLNLYLMVSLFDTAVSLDHRDMKVKRDKQTLQHEFEFISMLLTKDTTRSELEFVARKLEDSGMVVKKRSDRIIFGRIEVVFKEDKVYLVNEN